MMDVVYEWCNGCSFSKICKMTDIFEGMPCWLLCITQSWIYKVRKTLRINICNISFVILLNYITIDFCKYIFMIDLIYIALWLSFLLGGFVCTLIFWRFTKLVFITSHNKSSEMATGFFSVEMCKCYPISLHKWILLFSFINFLPFISDLCVLTWLIIIIFLHVNFTQ